MQAADFPLVITREKFLVRGMATATGGERGNIWAQRMNDIAGVLQDVMSEWHQKRVGDHGFPEGMYCSIP